MEIYITDMTKVHIPYAVDIEEKSFSIPWSQNAFEESLSYDHALFLVAVSAETEKVVGYVGMYKIFNEGEIMNVAVHPDYRGMGIGTKLMKAIIEKGQEKDIKDIILEARQSNSTAITMYEKIGFKKIGIRKNFYEKPVEDAVVMNYRVLD